MKKFFCAPIGALCSVGKIDMPAIRPAVPFYRDVFDIGLSAELSSTDVGIAAIFFHKLEVFGPAVAFKK